MSSILKKHYFVKLIYCIHGILHVASLPIILLCFFFIIMPLKTSGNYLKTDESQLVIVVANVIPTWLHLELWVLQLLVESLQDFKEDARIVVSLQNFQLFVGFILLPSNQWVLDNQSLLKNRQADLAFLSEEEYQKVHIFYASGKYSQLNIQFQ